MSEDEAAAGKSPEDPKVIEQSTVKPVERTGTAESSKAS